MRLAGGKWNDTRPVIAYPASVPGDRVQYDVYYPAHREHRLAPRAPNRLLFCVSQAGAPSWTPRARRATVPPYGSRGCLAPTRNKTCSKTSQVSILCIVLCVIEPESTRSTVCPARARWSETLRLAHSLRAGGVCKNKFEPCENFMQIWRPGAGRGGARAHGGGGVSAIRDLGLLSF